ncbi:TPA: hypothetical protein I4G56_21255 [Enterobacter asburiae]|jgi:hypothetical protein|nr:hypothetical protein EI562_05435 [Enterobacter asburiae]NEV81469.1 hypothetical protein [Enterobacter asburiae]NQF31842.1 hypothetical protein [Enterobacter asburiae]RUO00283.1 hypothetical protein EKN24_02570 [Enterobacter asburiae]HAS1756847.1 hypothetical protein [Enterobacter asburiae]
MPDIHYGRVLILILLPYKRPVFRRKRDVIARHSSSVAITQIDIKIAALFFYDNKFPTIQPNVCQQQWGSHGHGQTQ